MRSATSSVADAAFAALADPTRRRVLELLRDREEMTAGELAAAFPDISRPAVSKHLRVLREAGVIRQRLEGTTRLNLLRRDELEARFPGLVDAVLSAAGRQ